MKSVKWLAGAMIAVVFSCTQKKEDKSIDNKVALESKNIYTNDSCYYYLRKSREIDSALLNALTYDEKLAIEANNIFVKCAFLCHDDSISPLYLMKAAQLSQTLQRLNMAEKYLLKIIHEYPKTKLLPAVKLLLAQYYADKNMLNQPDEAKKILHQIIKDYPQTVWAENAAAALQWVGKSDNEILKELKKKR